MPQTERILSPEEQQAKIDEVRKLLGPLANQFQNFSSDASISRYLRARNWNAEKACKMLKGTLNWRLEYKPEAIQWEDIAHEAETGKIYRAEYTDKHGRPVLVMRPGFQNTSSTKGQIRYLVYSMEHAILNLGEELEQMVWLIDFQGWNMASVSVRVAHETVHVLQDYYPERLGIAILYDPPKIFESFWKMVKPFVESKTNKKVKFVYSDDANSYKMMTDLFDIKELETAFGGRNDAAFNYTEFSKRMKEEDVKISSTFPSPTVAPKLQNSEGSPEEDDESGKRSPMNMVEGKKFGDDEIGEKRRCKNARLKRFRIL